MRRVRRAAPAKVNLGLEVVGRRPGGYHELVTVMQTLELADTVIVETAESIEGSTSMPELAAEDDLAVQAARLWRAELKPQAGARIHVDKHIAIAAGLGGGSSDAAAVLMALDELWSTNGTHAQLQKAASTLGADVPFLLRGGTALGTSRGDKLHHLPAAPMRYVVLVRPHLRLATADVYAELRPSEWSGGSQTRALAKAIASGELPHGLMRNDLTKAAVRLVPAISNVLQALQIVGAKPALLSGSGATCFGLFDDKDQAQSAFQRLCLPKYWTQLSQFRRIDVT